MSSFFTSGTIDTRSYDRSKLPEGIYKVRLVDFADHLAAHSGNRTQCDFLVVAGPTAIGSKKGHIVSHAADAAWKQERARGEIAVMLGAFAGMGREESGFKVNAEFFVANTRNVQYVNGGKDVGTVTRSSTELPLVKDQAEAILVVRPYFDRKTGQRKNNPKTGEPSVIYEFTTLSSGLEPTVGQVFQGSATEEAPPAPDSLESDALELALADGWKANGESGWFYKKGEPAQLKAPALRAKYAVSY